MKIMESKSEPIKQNIAMADSKTELIEAQNLQAEEDFIYSELQFKKILVEPESKKFSEVFIKDLNLTNFNEVDIVYSRNILNSIRDFNMFGLNNASKEILIPNLFSVVNTARSRDGFERKAQITIKKDETATITQKGSSGNVMDKLLRRGK